MANRRTHLVIIDPQNDFCDLPADYCPLDPVNPQQRLSPALPVAGAHARGVALLDQPLHQRLQHKLFFVQVEIQGAALPDIILARPQPFHVLAPDATVKAASHRPVARPASILGTRAARVYNRLQRPSGDSWKPLQNCARFSTG